MLCVSTKNNATASYSTSKCVFRVGMSVIVLGSTHCQKYFNTPVWQLVETSAYCKQPWSKQTNWVKELHRSWITLLDRNRVQCEFFNPLTWAWKHTHHIVKHCKQSVYECTVSRRARESIPLAHPCSYYYLLSPSILFCTSYLFAHLIVCALFNSIAHFTLYFSFLYLYLYICSCVVCTFI